MSAVLSLHAKGSDRSKNALLLPTSKKNQSCESSDDQQCDTVRKGDFKIEGGVTYFYPQSHLFRKIYGGCANYHVTFSRKLSDHWDVWTGVNYFNKDGRSTHLHQRTNIKIIPISLGLKRLFPTHFNWADIVFYINGGFKYYFVKIHDRSDFVRQHTNRGGLGGVFGAGSYIYFAKHWYLNTFIDYSFKRFHNVPQHHVLDVGGWDFGGGIGCSF